MTTKFYQINGVWNTYQYWHDNYGYTTEPTQSMNFKSSASGTWGTNVNPGYFTSPGGYTIDNWSFWSDGIVGWKDIDELALAGAYPATAIDILLERNGTIANAVYVDDSDELYYLIDGYLSDGWRPWNEVEADGWQVYEGNQPYYMVVNETTGEIVYSISETEDNPSMIFSQVGHIEMPDSEMIICIELGVPVQSFYFTSNGRNETENTTLPVDSNIPLYWADGSLVDDSEGWASEYNGSPVLALTKADMNMFAALPNDKVVSVDHSGTDCLDFYGEAEEVVLKVKWGDAVTIPEGFIVTEIRTFVGYAFPSYFGDVSGGKAVAWPEKNVYFDNIDGHTMTQYATGTSGSETWPLVEVFQCTSLHGASGKYLTVGYRNSTAEWVTQDRLTNGTDLTFGDYSVYLKGNNTTAINDAINSGYPVRFLWFIWDSTQGQWYEAVWWKTPEAFRVPQSLWSFSDGVFSWLGDSEDTTSLAWYYKHDWDGFTMEGFDGVWYYIHCIRQISNRSAYSVQVEKKFTDILTLWAKITDNSEKMYLQTRVINTSTPNSTYLYALYTDEALTQRFVIDSNKTYELGVFKGQNFAPYDIQDVSQMPSTTVSGSGAVSGFLLVDQSGAYLWAATNNTYSTYVNAPGNKLSFKCRVSEPPAPSELTAYFTNTGTAYEYDTQINQGGGRNLYDASGAALYYDSSKTYTITGLYNVAGELLTFGDGDSLGDNSTYLFYNRGINLARVFAHHITYTES